MPVAAALIALVGWVTLLPGAARADFTDSGQSLVSFQGNDSRDVALGDLDGDTDLDAFVAQGGTGDPQPNVIWENTGGGVFQEGAGFGNEVSRGLALGDLDGDGDLDAFVGGDGGARVWLNQGFDQLGTEGDFLDSGQVLGGDCSDVALGELDATPGLDAIVVNRQGGVSQVAQVWWNDGSGTFAAGPVLGAGGSIGAGVATAAPDFDIVTSGTQPGSIEGVALHENQGGGVFGAGPIQSVGGVAQRVALGDLDGDTDPDVAVASLSAVTIFWNEAGVLAPGPVLATPAAVDVVISDLDGDLDADLVVANGQIAVTTFPNQVFEQTTPGTFVDSGQSLGLSGTRAIALGDLDGAAGLDAFFANSGPNEVWLGDGGEPPPPVDLGDWQSEALAIVGRSGRQPSIAVDADGDVHISYLQLDGGRDRVMYAHFDGVVWHSEQVAVAVVTSPTSIPQFRETSIAVDATGEPRIAFSHDPLELRHARRTEGAWEDELVVDNALRDDASLEIGSDGLSRIAYLGPRPGMDVDEVRLAVERAGGGWDTEGVQEAGAATLSLVLDATDQPSISFYDRQSGGPSTPLLLATRVGAAWTSEVVVAADPANVHGEQLAIDSEGRLHVAALTDAGIVWLVDDGGWVTQLVPGTPPAGFGPRVSLALDSNDLPHIAYTKDAGGGTSSLSVAHWDGAVWEIAESLALGGQALRMPSIAVDPAGDAHVVHHDDRWGELRYTVHSPPWRRLVVASGSSHRLPGLAHGIDGPEMSFAREAAPDATIHHSRWTGEGWEESALGVGSPAPQRSPVVEGGGQVASYADVTRAVLLNEWNGASWDAEEVTRVAAGRAIGADLATPGFPSTPTVVWWETAPDGDYLRVGERVAGAWGVEEVRVGDPDSVANLAAANVPGELAVAIYDSDRGTLELWSRIEGEWVQSSIDGGGGLDRGRAVRAAGTRRGSVAAVYADGNGDLRYAHRNDAVWTTRAVLPGVGALDGLALSLARDQVEFPFVGYAPADDGTIRVAYPEAGPDQVWTVEVVEPEDAAGSATEVDLVHASRARLAYRDAAGSLVHAFQIGERNVPPALHVGTFDAEYFPTSWCEFALAFFGFELSARGAGPAGPLGDFDVLERLTYQFAATPEGLVWIDLYGTHISEWSTLGIADPELGWDAYRTMQNLMPGLEAMVTGRGDEVYVSQEMVDQALDIWTRIAAEASPEFAQVIETELARFADLGDFVGLTFDEWAETLGAPPLGPEICGGCIDEDGDGLVDLADPDCCAAPEPLSLVRGLLKERDGATGLSLKAELATLDPGIGASPIDLQVQVLGESGQRLCAEFPAESAKGKKSAWLYKNKKGSLPEAAGLKNATFKRKKDGTVKVKLAGKRAALETPAEGPVFVLVGFRDEAAGESSNMCASTVESFREKKPGKLVLP